VQQEQFEAEEDDEGEEAGTFRRASAEVLATRKIIKVKRLVTYAVYCVDDRLRLRESHFPIGAIAALVMRWQNRLLQHLELQPLHLSLLPSQATSLLLLHKEVLLSRPRRPRPARAPSSARRFAN
jgi:hypothetical protein